MESLILVIKGFIMGIANIIPGVSGGTLALTLGIYEKFIGAISHFFEKFKENLRFLVPIFIGMGLSIVSMSSVISASFEHYPIPTTLFFMGLVLGGIPMLMGFVKDKKEKKQVSSYFCACNGTCFFRRNLRKWIRRSEFNKCIHTRIWTTLYSRSNSCCYDGNTRN